jgi:molybdate transport system substrate-binding protein
VVLALSACGGDDAPSSERLDVSAATSLKTALSEAAPAFDGAQVRLSFAGSDQLAARIRAGARPDVFAAANAKLPAALAAEGLVEPPVEFATNELVLAVPRESEKVASVRDLAASGIKLAVGAPAVPVGAYTQRVLGRLDPALGRRILENVKSSEPDVAGIVGKLTQGAVDAGFVYVTDVEAANGLLRAITLPKELQPTVVYGAAVVRDSPHDEAARRYVRELVSGPAAKSLRKAGFGAAP